MWYEPEVVYYEPEVEYPECDLSDETQAAITPNLMFRHGPIDDD